MQLKRGIRENQQIRNLLFEKTHIISNPLARIPQKTKRGHKLLISKMKKGLSSQFLRTLKV